MCLKYLSCIRFGLSLNYAHWLTVNYASGCVVFVRKFSVPITDL